MPNNITITLPYLPPSIWSRNGRSHWAPMNRVKDEIADDVKVLLLEAGAMPEKPLDRCQITVQYVLPNHRRRDADNLITSTKPVLDSLSTNGVIADDDLAHIGFPIYEVDEEESYQKKEATRIIIRPM